MPLYDFRCKCGIEFDEFRKVDDRDRYLECPLCGGTMERFMAQRRRAITTDDIPGGLWVENLGKRPVKVYSHSARLRLAAERGLQPFVRHQPEVGSDKSKFTSDWSKGSIDPYTMAAAEALVRDRSKGSNASDDDGSATEIRVDFKVESRSGTDLRNFMSQLRRAVDE